MPNEQIDGYSLYIYLLKRKAEREARWVEEDPISKAEKRMGA